MATRHQTFLIRCDKGREGIMRLPVARHGGITGKGFKMIAQRFFDGATHTQGRMQYALNLEAFTSGESLLQAVQKYQKNLI